MPYMNQIHLIGKLVTDPKLEYKTYRGEELPSCWAMVLSEQKRKSKTPGRYRSVKRMCILVRVYNQMAERWAHYQKRYDWVVVTGELVLNTKTSTLTGMKQTYPWIRADTMQFLLPRMAKFKKGHALVRTDELRSLKLHMKTHPPGNESPFSDEEQEVFLDQVEKEMDTEHESLTDAEEACMLQFREWDELRHPLLQPEDFHEEDESPFSVDLDAY